MLSQQKLDTLIGQFAKLAVERIDSVRLAAGEGLIEIAQIEGHEGRKVMKGKGLLVDAIQEYVPIFHTFALRN